MRIAATSASSGGRYLLAIALWLSAGPAPAQAQLFEATPPMRPPADVPGAPPPVQNLAPPGGAAAPKGPMLQSLPPAATTPSMQSQAPATPSGQAVLGVSARFGRDLPAIPAGLHWRIYPVRPDQRALR